jgi:hypothetical protein
MIMLQITDISQVPDVFFGCGELEYDLLPDSLAIAAANAASPYRAMWRDPNWQARLLDTVSPIPLIRLARARQRGFGGGGDHAPRLAVGAR